MRFCSLLKNGVTLTSDFHTNHIIPNVFMRRIDRQYRMMSVEKSTIYCGGMQEEDRQAIHDQFHLDVGLLPVIYLGLPLLTKRMGKSVY